MKNLILFYLLFTIMGLSAQPNPGDTYREYVWLPDMVKEGGKFLRVGGKLDYRISEQQLAPDGHKDGFIPFGQSVDLTNALRAELVLERIESHDGTKGLTLQWNDSEWLPVADMPALPAPQEAYMFHNYPVVEIPLESIREGMNNQFRLKVDSTQRWGWPQNIFYGVTLRVYYPTAPSMQAFQLDGINPGEVLAENVQLSLKPADLSAVQKVEYLGRYVEVDWDGNGAYDQWQGHPHRGVLRNHIGTASQAPFNLEWDLSWLPNQPDGIDLCARVHLEDGRIYQTEAIKNLGLDRGYAVELCRPYGQPVNWSTREDSFTAYLPVHGNLSLADSLQISWRSWSPCYANGVYLNGKKIYDSSRPCYDYAEHSLTIAAEGMLKSGENTIATGVTPYIDGKMVHGMEVQWPGIMMKIKYRQSSQVDIRITETTYEGRPHFLVSTPGATYYFDKAGGGFSRLIDPAGRDWIRFKMKPWGEYPAAAASAFRGIPNTVFQSEDGGAGHPGHDLCETIVEGPNSLITTTKSGKWQWKWTFFLDHARLDILKMDVNHAYWFLYEGPVGGRFAPGQSYFGTNLGRPDRRPYDYYKGNSMFGIWQWAYFGREDQDRVLYVMQQEPDSLLDTFGYLGNTEAGIESPDGMVVFGFGRSPDTKGLFTRPQTFFLGFWEEKVLTEKAHRRLGRFMNVLGNSDAHEETEQRR